MGVAAAVRALDAHQLQAKNEAVLDELIAYLQARQEYIPNDQQRRREQHT